MVHDVHRCIQREKKPHSVNPMILANSLTASFTSLIPPIHLHTIVNQEINTNNAVGVSRKCGFLISDKITPLSAVISPQLSDSGIWHSTAISIKTLNAEKQSTAGKSPETRRPARQCLHVYRRFTCSAHLIVPVLSPTVILIISYPEQAAKPSVPH